MEYTTDGLTLEAIDVQPNPDERRALLERVAASVPLKRATRLRDFLLYVGHQSLKEGCPEIHEQEIGSVVFGRPLGYDTGQDNIVRVNATELRKRLEMYFASEGVRETLVFDIPRGCYKPVFRRRTVDARVEQASVEGQISTVIPQLPDPVLAGRATSDRGLLILSALAILMLAVACLALLRQNRTMRRAFYEWEGKPALTAFWPAFLHSHQQTDIILADTSVALIEDITKQPISLSDYLNRSYIHEIQSPELSPDRRADLNLIVSRHNGSVGDFRVAQQILALDRLSSTIHLHFARDYMPYSIKQNNVILIGSRKSNPWVHLFDDRLNFTIEYDSNLIQNYVANRNPQHGEQAIYAAPIDPYASVGYSVIAFLPNPSHTGNAILLAGTNSDATNAAGEFLTSEESLEKLQSTLHVREFPYFEALLKTTHLSGTSFNAEIVAYRSYPDLR